METVRVWTKPGIDQSSDLTWTHSKYGQIVVSDQSSDKNRIQSEFEQTWTQSEFGQNLDTVRVRTKPGYNQSSDKNWTQSEFGQNLNTVRVRTKPGNNPSSDKTWTQSEFGQNWTQSEFGQNLDTVRFRTKPGHSQSSEKTWTQSEFGQNLDTIRVRTNLVHTVGYRAKKINVVTGQSSEKTWHRARVRKDIAAFRETLFWILFFHCKWSIISGFIWNNEIPLLVSSDSPNIISSNYKRDKIVIGRLGWQLHKKINY